MDLSTINWLAVLAAAISSFIIGGLWYGPLLGKAWMRAAGVGEETLKQGSQGMIFGVSFALQLVAAAVLALFIGPEADLAFGLAAGGAVGLFWVSTAFGVVYLFERRPLGHWAINSGYQVLAFLVMGAILGAW